MRGIPILFKKDGWGLPIRQINELRYVGEGGDDCSLPIVRGTSGAKAHSHFDQLMAYRPSRRDLFQVVYLSQPPFLFLST